MTLRLLSRIWTFAALGFLFAPAMCGQIVWTDPPFPTQNDQVTLYYDVAEGNAALIDEEPPCPPCPFVYAHTGVITSESTSPSDWQYVHNPWPNGNNGSQANNGNALCARKNIFQKAVRILLAHVQSLRNTMCQKKAPKSSLSAVAERGTV